MAPQWKFNSFVTVTTYCVPDLPNIKGFSGQLWHTILTFANGTSCMIQQAYKYVYSSLRSCLMNFKLKITNILKSNGGTVKE